MKEQGYRPNVSAFASLMKVFAAQEEFGHISEARCVIIV
jgi:hypothetical protein